MTTSPIESQSGKLTQVLEGIKKGNTLVKNWKLTIPSEPSAYAEWYKENKIVLEALSQSLTKALEDWNSFLWANANDISIIQEAEKKYDALTPADKATVDIYRKASTVAATLAQIQPKIQPSNYDDRKIVRNIKSWTVNTLTSASFLDDTTFTEGGIWSIKKLWKLWLDAIGQEYYLINFSGSKYGVLRIPKDESSVVQVAWLDSEQSESVKQGKYKPIRDNITNLPYANAELDGSSIVFNMRNIFANLPASIYEQLLKSA